MANPCCHRRPREKTFPSCGLLCARDVGAAIRTATTGRPTAFVAEPNQGVGGFITPPPECFVEVKAILDRYGIPFVCDEVQTGWGRLGVAEVGVRAYRVEPEVVVFAKGLANGIPIGGNPIATTAALANPNCVATRNLRENALRVGARLRDRLTGLAERCPLIGDVRGVGLPIGVELVRDRATREPAPGVLARVLDGPKGDGARADRRAGRAARQRDPHLPAAGGERGGRRRGGGDPRRGVRRRRCLIGWGSCGS